MVMVKQGAHLLRGDPRQLRDVVVPSRLQPFLDEGMPHRTIACDEL